ncbi:MAG: DUF4280 domain-containing protein [Dysgonomonas sp.]
MATYVKSGTRIKCSFGTTPSTIQAMPGRTTKVGGATFANIMDNKPMVNIKPFGLCRCLANPTVASATSAAMGVLTPMPCIPNTVAAPWAPGNPTLLVGRMPALMDDGKLMCMWGGVIQIS